MIVVGKPLLVAWKNSIRRIPKIKRGTTAKANVVVVSGVVVVTAVVVATARVMVVADAATTTNEVMVVLSVKVRGLDFILL